MTQEERVQLLIALRALMNASEWYQKEAETRSKMVAGLFARRRNTELKDLADTARKNGDEMIASYRNITDQIPASWYTVPMCGHLIMIIEHGYAESVSDLVRNYRVYFKALQDESKSSTCSA